jgi:hypothetical protein
MKNSSDTIGNQIRDLPYRVSHTCGITFYKHLTCLATPGKVSRNPGECVQPTDVHDPCVFVCLHLPIGTQAKLRATYWNVRQPLTVMHTIANER